MPIYEYQCEKGHAFEKLQRISDPPVEHCTICSGKAWRIVSLCSHPKGAGIYLFDRRFGNRDVLHDPAFSDRERKAVVTEALQGKRRPMKRAYPG